ncbi:MAG: pyridoxamine 5'-phosphate oxidase [Gemmatimonadetes bacterium]|nr:pyridoxamine 5'-phosphate oxidase [Gemmatimonadota bacterium]
MEIGEQRRQYGGGPIRDSEMDPDPFRQFERWFNDALRAGLVDPTAMVLATATMDGRPSARVVLLKSFDERGFVFFTDYESRKGQELTENPHAAIVFYWGPLNRQIGLRGTVTKISREESEAYFQTRPRRSQLAAWTSRQSRVIRSREELDRRMEEMERLYAEGPVPPPPCWGGMRLTPVEFEFWQGRPDRLHDRIRYVREESGGWRIERLSP